MNIEETIIETASKVLLEELTTLETRIWEQQWTYLDALEHELDIVEDHADHAVIYD